MKRSLCGALICLSILSLSPAWGQTPPPLEDSSIPDALDLDRRRSPSYRFELSPYGGRYFGDKLETSFLTGGNLQWNLTGGLALATHLGYSRFQADATSALGLGLGDRDGLLFDGGFVLTKTAAYKGKKKVIEADFFTSLGGGILRLDGANRGGGYVGVGMKTRTRVPWFALRLEVRNLFTSVPNPGGSDFEHALVLQIGPTFFIPPEM